MAIYRYVRPRFLHKFYTLLHNTTGTYSGSEVSACICKYCVLFHNTWADSRPFQLSLCYSTCPGFPTTRFPCRNYSNSENCLYRLDRLLLVYYISCFSAVTLYRVCWRSLLRLRCISLWVCRRLPGNSAVGSNRFSNYRNRKRRGTCRLLCCVYKLPGNRQEIKVKKEKPVSDCYVN